MLQILGLLLLFAVCVVLVFVILIQSGKGGGLAGLGGGSETMFGASPSRFKRFTVICAILFGLCIISLNLMVKFNSPAKEKAVKAKAPASSTTAPGAPAPVVPAKNNNK